MFMASNFVGAWLWHIGTDLVSILRFYTVLFVVMTLGFAFASRLGRHIPSTRLMATGIVLNIIYLALLLALKTQARHYYGLLAALEGLSATFYWLALFVLASAWVNTDQSEWFNGITGTLEAVLGLVIPPLSGWIISRLPGLTGYRTIFAVALLSLLGSLFLIARAPGGSSRTPSPFSYPLGTNPPGWRALGWSFGALGLRDGLYFFVPSLLLYILTGNAILLGIYLALQSVIEGAVFGLLSRSPRKISRIHRLSIATAISLLALPMAFFRLTPSTLFGLGVLIALAYPPYKVALESSALTLIDRYSRTDSDRIRLTAAKEVWINGGRLLSLVFLLGIFALVPHFRLGEFRWIFALWSLVPVIILVTFRKTVDL